MTARLRSVPVEMSSRLSRKSILPSCADEGFVSPVSVTCTGFGVSRELGRLPSNHSLLFLR